MKTREDRGALASLVSHGITLPGFTFGKSVTWAIHGIPLRGFTFGMGVTWATHGIPRPRFTGMIKRAATPN